MSETRKVSTGLTIEEVEGAALELGLTTIHNGNVQLYSRQTRVDLVVQQGEYANVGFTEKEGIAEAVYDADHQGLCGRILAKATERRIKSRLGRKARYAQFSETDRKIRVEVR